MKEKKTGRLAVSEKTKKIWYKYCKKNDLHAMPHLETIMTKLATGEAVLTTVYYVKANFKFEAGNE